MTLPSLALAAPGDHPLRTWTSTDGKAISASLLHSNRESVTLKLEDGREAIVALDRLSESDRKYLAGLSATGQNIRVAAMPEETKIDPNVDVEGGPRVFLTPHFQFESDQGVSRGFIGEASRVFEGTLKAVESLPLGIVPKPAEGETRFRTLFLGRESFDRELAATPGGPPSAPGTMVAGVYIPSRKEVLVPFSSIGAGNSGSQKTLRRSSDTSTLIHEITHQVMHDWLVLMPVWLSEGLAEYLSAIPYQNGRFEFRNSAAGLTETLAEEYGLGMGRPVPMRHPSNLVGAGDQSWQGGAGDYLSSLLLVYYFIHLDQPDKPAASLAAYLHLLDRSKADTEAFIAEYNAAVDDFEAKRLAYNRQVDAFNQLLVKFKADVAAYNQRIDLYNQQVQANVPPDQRVVVGDKPVEPQLPKPIEVPAILKENAAGGGPVDILKMMREKALPALYRDRDPEALAASIQEAYAGMRITISFVSANGRVNP